jgi:zinc transport system permease protein
MKLIGLIVILALISIAPFIASFFANSLFYMFIFSFLLSLFFVITGLFLSCFYDISSGASIVVVCVVSLILFFIAKTILKIILNK